MRSLASDDWRSDRPYSSVRRPEKGNVGDLDTMSQNAAIKAAMAKRNPKPQTLSHYDAAGRATMVDVSSKSPTVREAEAHAFVAMSRKVVRALPRNPKGDPLEVARVAGVMAAKRTAELIPMCHPIPLSKVGDPRRSAEGRNRHSHACPYYRRHRSGNGGPGRGFRRRAYCL